jgi:senataxin
MIHLLDDPEEQYSLYLEKRAENHKHNAQKNEDDGKHREDEDYPLTFEKFVKNEFDSIFEPLKICMVDMYTHIPTSCISLNVVNNMVWALGLLKSIKSSLHTIGVANEVVFKDFKVSSSIVGCLTQLRTKCTNTLKLLPKEFSVPINEYALRNFCLENACLIFCTASTSAKLQSVEGPRPLELLVIDEAAQLKECESAIPLQLSGLRHAILVGDERQLPAMVKSKVLILSFAFSILYKL